MAGIQDLIPTLWNFKICEPEIDPDDDFKDEIRHSLKKLSKLVELDTYEVNVENGRTVAKVVNTLVNVSQESPHRRPNRPCITRSVCKNPILPSSRVTHSKMVSNSCAKP